MTRIIKLELVIDGDDEEAYEDVCDDLVLADFIEVNGNDALVRLAKGVTGDE